MIWVGAAVGGGEAVGAGAGGKSAHIVKIRYVCQYPSDSANCPCLITCERAVNNADHADDLNHADDDDDDDDGHEQGKTGRGTRSPKETKMKHPVNVPPTTPQASFCSSGIGTLDHVCASSNRAPAKSTSSVPDRNVPAAGGAGSWR